MTNFEKAVRVFGEANRVFAEMYEDIETVGDLIELWGWNSRELKEEILHELYRSKELVDVNITDDGEIEDEDGTLNSYRALAKAIKNYKF